MPPSVIKRKQKGKEKKRETAERHCSGQGKPAEKDGNKTGSAGFLFHAFPGRRRTKPFRRRNGRKSGFSVSLRSGRRNVRRSVLPYIVTELSGGLNGRECQNSTYPAEIRCGHSPRKEIKRQQPRNCCLFMFIQANRLAIFNLSAIMAINSLLVGLPRSTSMV